jgi:hypothetical protein
MSPTDLVQELKPLYAPSAKHAAIVEVPELHFLMVGGGGDPNLSQEYQDAIGALYSAAYTLKFTLKKADPERDFTVAPLEGLWWTDDESPSVTSVMSDKDSWHWTMMIAVPPAVTAAEVAAAVEAAARKRPNPALASLRLETFAEGLAAQIMHIGPYSEETPTIERLHAFVADQGYELVGRHHEIYLSDPGRTAPERLKTIVRHPMRERGKA